MNEKKAVKAFVVAGVSSGSGKTTVVGAIAAALVERGLTVQIYKVGPDYIDPGHHRAITGRPVRSLDIWMMGEEGIRANFCRGLQGADVAIVEGVGGLFDGLGTTELASTAQVAKILNLPVVLVADAWGMSRSAAALVKGFRDFDPHLTLAGVVFNLVGSEGHAKLLEDSIRPLGVELLGHILRRRKGAIPERHLGLKLAQELDWDSRLEVLRGLASGLRIDTMLELATDVEGIFPVRPWVSSPFGSRKVAVARDAAFAFAYHESLEAIEEAGGELLFFSPLQGDGIPSQAESLYLPGGYPELHGESLETNHRFRRDIEEMVASNCPVYAECGGLIYLANKVEYKGRVFRMAGVFPVNISFGGRPLLGYAVGIAKENHPFLGRGSEVRGHVFHYSVAQVFGEVRHPYLLRVPTRGIEVEEGYTKGNTIATYLHLNLAFALGILEGLWGGYGG